MPANEERTAAFHTAATQPAHHWPAIPKPIPSSPEIVKPGGAIVLGGDPLPADLADLGRCRTIRGATA